MGLLVKMDCFDGLLRWIIIWGVALLSQWHIQVVSETGIPVWPPKLWCPKNTFHIFFFQLCIAHSTMPQVCINRLEGKGWAEKPENRFQLNTIKACLQNKSLVWFSFLERMNEWCWSSKCKTSQECGSLVKVWPRKT